MPKFNGQNKKRNNPRYFLNETVERGEIEEGEKERSWDDAYAMGLPEPEFRAPWNSTKDMIDKLGEQAREASKAIYGYKVDVGNMTLDQIQDLLYDMSNSDVQRAMDDEAQREDDEAIGMQDDELDNSPKRMGMGRMEEEEKPKKKGNHDDGDDEDEKCDYVPCGDRKPSSEKKSKKSEIKEMIAKELASLLSESYEEKEWSGRDPYDDDGRVDPTPIPDEELTPAQVLSNKVEAFRKKHWSDLSPRQLDYVNFIEDGLYFGFPKTARRSKEEYMQDIENALKSGDEGLMQYFKS